MSDTFFERSFLDPEARTVEERHGQGILTLFGGEPYRATGCLLPDSEVTNAICLAAPGGDQVWARPVGPDKRLWRRGRLIVEPGVALRFVDEPSADVSAGFVIAKPSLERDLAASRHIQLCVRSKLFALLLYVALYGIEWRHIESSETWSCSWRYAEGIISSLRGEPGFGMWYLLEYEQTLEEGTIDEVVLAEIAALGWTPVTNDGDRA